MTPDFKTVVENLTKQRENAVNEARTLSEKLNQLNSQISEYNGAIAVADSFAKMAEKDETGKESEKSTPQMKVVEDASLVEN